MGRSILIVDGDQGFAQSAQDALEILGIQVHVVDDASIDVIRKLRPSVLLMNVELGRKQVAGFSLCSRIRNDKDLKSLPIFLTSSEATPQSLEKHAQSPYRADEYAIKPIAVEDLVARLTKMLESAPEPSISDNGVSDTDDDADFEDSPRTPLPPPIPRGATGGPPPLPQPPPLRNRTGDVAPKPSMPEPPAIAGPPALPRETQDEGELWPKEKYEDSFRQAMATEPEQALGRASPEERLNALRNLIKKYQTREKSLRGTWEEVMQRGGELARTIAAAEFSKHQETQRLEEVIRNRDTLQSRVKAVEGEFRAFQEEITRIFQEKDSEESEKAERAQQLEDENAQLKEQVQQAHEALSDDQRRFKLLQEEIEEIEALRSSSEQKTQEIADLRARLETVEHVSADRGTEVQRLSDQLDQMRLEKDAVEKQLERDYQAKLEALQAEQHERAFSDEAEHLAQVESLEERHRQLLETLNSTHEAEASEYETRRLAASDQILALNEQVAELEGQLEAALGKDDRIGELEAAMRELQENAEAERSEAGRRITELEEELDRVQTDLFERLTEVDHFRKSAVNLESRTHDLDTALKTAEKALKQSKAEVAQLKKTAAEKIALDEQVKNVEHQLTRLEEKDRQTTKMLEEERARWQRAEDLVRKAKEKLETHAQDKQKLEAEFETRLEEEMASRQEVEAMLVSERNARAEVEAQAEELQGDLSRRENELSDAYSEATSLKRKLEALAQQLDGVQRQSAGKDVELEGLKRSIEDAGAQIGSLRAEVDALSAAEEELAEARASEAALIKEIEQKAERVRALEGLTGEMKQELERAKVESRSMAERQKLLKKAAGVLEKARRSMPEQYFAAEVLAEAAVQDALKPRMSSGVAMELSDAVDPNYQPPTAVIHQAALVANLTETLDHSQENAAPFAALMAEIQASEEDIGSGFDEKFAAEPTTENPRIPSGVTKALKDQKQKQMTPKRNNPRVGGALSQPISRRSQDKDEEEEEEGLVTEIIRLDKIE